MAALSDRDRFTLLAIGRLQAGLTAAQVADYLQQRYGVPTAQAAASIVAAAQVALANAVGASFAAPTDTIGAATGQPNRATPLIVEATVTFDVPGRGKEIRTLRLEDVTAQTTIEEVNQRIQDNAEEWLDTSLPEGSTMSWTTRYIL